MRDFPERMGKFELELAMEKTKLMSFGRFAKGNSKDGKTDTFDFLGFTFCNGTCRNGKYRVHIQTCQRKLKEKRQAVKAWLREHMHAPVALTFQSLNRKLQGHVNYYGINGNSKMVANFFLYVKTAFIRVLRARGQKHPIKWIDFNRMWDFYIKPTEGFRDDLAMMKQKYESTGVLEEPYAGVRQEVTFSYILVQGCLLSQ